MATRIGGSRRKTRHKLKKQIRKKGKISVDKFFQSFTAGEKVCLIAEPAIQGGMFHPRFHGKAGTIVGNKGRCYTVTFTDQNKMKQVIVHPVHLRKF